jgi:hypothetical protein
MTKKEFQNQPGLVMEKDVVSLGYARATLEKFVACGILAKVKPAGCSQARYRKRQLAQLMEWNEIVALDEQLFKREPLLMRRKAVLRWTGVSKGTLAKLIDAGTLRHVQPAGFAEGKFPKEQIAALLGMEHCV